MFRFWRIINEILKVSEKILLWHCQLVTDVKAAMFIVKKKTFPVLEFSLFLMQILWKMTFSVNLHGNLVTWSQTKDSVVVDI